MPIGIDAPPGNNDTPMASVWTRKKVIHIQGVLQRTIPQVIHTVGITLCIMWGRARRPHLRGLDHLIIVVISVADTTETAGRSTP